MDSTQIIIAVAIVLAIGIGIMFAALNRRSKKNARKIWSRI